jgi:hypothetical protein
MQDTKASWSPFKTLNRSYRYNSLVAIRKALKLRSGKDWDIRFNINNNGSYTATITPPKLSTGRLCEQTKEEIASLLSLDTASIGDTGATFVFDNQNCSEYLLRAIG